jgi:putative transposase
MGQSLSANYVHLIFSTHRRTRIITSEMVPRLFDYMAGVVQNLNSILQAAGGTADHVHLLIRLHPQVALADLVRTIKSNSSRWIKDTFPASPSFGWQSGYSAFGVSSSAVESVVTYIRQQEEHHRVRTFGEEYREFLIKSGVEFDERYLLD